MNEYLNIYLSESGQTQDSYKPLEYMIWMSHKREEFAKAARLEKLPFGGYAKPQGTEEKFSHWLKTGQMPQ